MIGVGCASFSAGLFTLSFRGGGESNGETSRENCVLGVGHACLHLKHQRLIHPAGEKVMAGLARTHRRASGKGI